MYPAIRTTAITPAATTSTMRPRPEPASTFGAFGRRAAGSARLRDGLPNEKESSIPAGIGTRPTT